MDALVSEGLPPGWARVRLSEILQPPEAVNPAAEFRGRKSFAYVSLTAIEPGKIVSAEMIAPASAPGRARQRIRVDDTLFSCVRVYLEKVVQVPASLDGEVCSTAFAVLRPQVGIDPGYLYWLTRRPEFIRAAEERQKGNSPPAIQDADLRSIEVPLAPSAEQARIVAAVNALFDEVEAGEAALARAREGLTQFRASLLHAACTGALTADWREANPANETADELLTTALDLRKKLWPGRYESPATLASTDLPALPVGWRWVTLDQLAVLPARNGISVKGNPEPPGVAALRLDAMQDRGLDFTRRRFIDIPANKATDLAIREGDFLISRANGSLSLMGRACVAGRPPAPTVFPDTMIRFRLASPELARWVSLAWRSAFLRNHLERRAKTSAGIWKISQDDMRSAPIPLPPAREITAALAAVETAHVEDGSLLAEGFAGELRQSILHVAFTGRLVPQDPADEPAAALIARLRTAPTGTPRPRQRRAAVQPDLIETLT
jgi:type I restriction enzyme S subunit